MSQEHDYDLSKKVRIKFKGMDYYVMPRYQNHYVDHDYERFSLQILKNNLGPESLFVDIGAHYGAYSLCAADGSKSSVIAVEPVSENFKLLQENIKANKLEDRITAYEYAASDTNGEAEFNIPWASDSAGFYDHPNAKTIKKQKVTVRKIDDVLKGKKADIIKIDTEGHEIGVLKGLTKSLKDNPNTQLIIEINPPLLEKAGETAESLLDYVKKADREIYMVGEDDFTMYRITDRLDAWPKYINEGNYANLYCVPSAGHQYLLFVSHSPYLGGAEIAMVEQIQELRSRGMQAHVILPADGPLQDVLVDKGIGHSVVAGYSFWARSPGSSLGSEKATVNNFINVKAAAQISEIAADIGATRVINNSIVNPWGYPAAKTNSLPLIWMAHEYGDLDHGLVFTHGVQAVRKFIVDNADLVVSCSDAVKKSLTSADHAKSQRVQTIYNFIDADEVTKLAAEKIQTPFKNTRSLHLCMVGTVSEGKGQTDAIDALHALDKESIDAELILLGSSSKDYLASLKKKVADLNLTGKVTFLGFQANPYPYIKASDALLVASRNEAFGRVTAEAMIVGTPVVGSNMGGTIEMIDDGETGFLFNATDTNDLVSAIKRLKDTNNIKGITANARKRITKLLNSQENADKLASLIDKLSVSPDEAKQGKVMVSEWVEAVATYNQEIKHRDEHNEQLSAQWQAALKRVEELEGVINDITHSRSWKVTKPLRRTSNKLKKTGK